MENLSIEILTELKPENEEDIKQLALELTEDASTKNSPENLRKIISNHDYLAIAAFDEDKIIGILILITYLLIEGEKKGWIEGLVVSENYRGQGIGRKLVEKVIEKAKGMGLKSLNLTSREKRIAANKLYQKMGFIRYETNVYRIKF